MKEKENWKRIQNKTDRNRKKAEREKNKNKKKQLKNQSLKNKGNKSLKNREALSNGRHRTGPTQHRALPNRKCRVAHTFKVTEEVVKFHVAVNTQRGMSIGLRLDVNMSSG